MFRDNNIIEIDKPCISEQEFIEFMLERDYNENMFNKDGTLNKNYSSSKVTGLISTILEDYSDEFFNKYGDQINIDLMLILKLKKSLIVIIKT